MLLWRQPGGARLPTRMGADLQLATTLQKEKDDAQMVRLRVWSHQGTGVGTAA